MNLLPQTTMRRLKKIQQIPSVWEGDRRPLSGIRSNLDPDLTEKGDCIIWVDGSEGLVRSMDVVSPEMGPEAVVRTLLRAIESPHNPAKPATPQKIIVRDRELQFFLRGVLQNLDITVDYVPNLPLIDEIFRGFETHSESPPNGLETKYQRLLSQVAEDIWDEAPWDLMADYDIVAIEINKWEIDTIYACVMGMQEREYGIILYRSLQSMKHFRSAVLEEDSTKELEKAFLAQDCWFLNFEIEDEDFDDDDDDFDFDTNADLIVSSSSDIRPLFGSIHPYEGMQPLRDREEVFIIYIALKALLQFYQETHDFFAENSTESLIREYDIEVPKINSDAEIHLKNIAKESLSVKVSNLPKLTSELLEMLDESENFDDENNHTLSIPIRDDLVPDGSLVRLTILPWNQIESLQNRSKVNIQLITQQPLKENISQEEGMPIILIQTSRPKARDLIDKIEEEGGLKGICFHPKDDFDPDDNDDFGIIQTNNGHLYFLAEFLVKEPKPLEAWEKWNQLCENKEDYFGLVVAMGITGASRGKPQLKDIMAVFETKRLTAKALGLGLLDLNLEDDEDDEDEEEYEDDE